jgi:hypothetical protein
MAALRVAAPFLVWFLFGVSQHLDVVARNRFAFLRGVTPAPRP